MDSCRRLLLANKAWVGEKTRLKPNYFQELAKDQRPEFLWIGCSDSRVPAEEITGLQPGEVFVHRNIANLVVHTDFNLMSVLQYAVDTLKVKHIIVCGHYGCGGVRAAMSRQRFGLLNKWLRYIKDTYQKNEAEIKAAGPDREAQTDKLVEMNVLQQVHNIAKTSIVQKAWREEKRPTVHGWVYRLDDGILRPLFEMEPNTPLDEIYQFDFDETPP